MKRYKIETDLSPVTVSGISMFNAQMMHRLKENPLTIAELKEILRDDLGNWKLPTDYSIKSGLDQLEKIDGITLTTMED